VKQPPKRDKHRQKGLEGLHVPLPPGVTPPLDPAFDVMDHLHAMMAQEVMERVAAGHDAREAALAAVERMEHRLRMGQLTAAVGTREGPIMQRRIWMDAGGLLWFAAPAAMSAEDVALAAATSRMGAGAVH